MNRVLGCAIAISLLGLTPASAGDAETMSTTAQTERRVASIAERLPALWGFVQQLADGIKAGTLTSQEQFLERCQTFYTADRMAAIEAVVPGIKHMASFDNGRTLGHVTAAMVALLDLDEYRSMPPGQQTAQQWVVLLHDIAKEPVGGRDHRHTFRSAAQAARIMPTLGFPVTAAYQSQFGEWFALTDRATRRAAGQEWEVQDNRKLPGIIDGARRVFAEPTRTAVVVIALHQSITSLAAWPVQAPLTKSEVAAYLNDDMLTPLLALTLADSAGWNLFDLPTLEAMYEETRAVFRALPRSPSRLNQR